ncbi:MAG: S9 family peptidase [Chloroflexota bacterium]|nr:S9 family peptidase [Chloroflexota bacterium]
MGSGGRLTLDDLERRPEPGMDAPGSVQFAPEGRSVTYLFAADGSLVRSLWRHDLLTGERTIVAEPLPETTREEALSHEDHLQRERTRTSELGVTEHAWASAAPEPTLLVPMAGHLFVAVGTETEQAVREIPGVDGASGAHLSPDGAFVAYVAAGDLWVIPVRGGSPRRLTDDAEPGVFNGLAEYVAAEELDRFDGAWWSADSRSIAYAHVDERGVQPFGEEQHRYPFAGGPNARVSLRVASLAGSGSREAELGMQPDDYLARVLPHPTGGWLVAVLPRDQRSLHWHRVGADGSAQRLWVEEAEPWINLDDHARVLPDGRVLLSSERSGFRHLEVRTPSGELERVLTSGDWVVTDVVAIAAARGEVLFSATHDGALDRHLYAVPLDAPRPLRDPQRLTVEPGWHAITARPDGEAWIDTWSDLEHAPRVTVASREGASTLVHESSTTAAHQGLDPPALVEVLAADGRTPLHAAIYRAGRRRSEGPAPGVVWVYGGPHSQYVKRSWELTADPLRQYLAQAGATVVVVDNRGTAFRGSAFEAPIRNRLGWNEVHDQAAAVRQLAERRELRGGGVGITGGSYGGFMTVLAMALEPDLFAVGAAIAPVIDWTGYDTAYSERYLGTPAANPDAYRQSSVLIHAADVRGSLLLMHGTADENVHPSHSTRLVEAFRSAGRELELVTLPGQRHRTRGAAIRTRDGRTAAHLLRGLGLPVPEELA